MTPCSMIFIFEEDGAKEFIDSKQNAANKIIIVCATEKISKKLSDLGYACKTIDAYSQDVSSELQKAIDWIQTWPDEPISNGKSFKELLVYEGVSIFWFLQTRFYLHRVRELIILIERIKQMLYAEKPEKIWIKGNEEIKLIVSSIYGSQNIAGFEQLEEKKSNRIRYKSYHGHPALKLLLLKIMRGTFLASMHRGKRGSKGRILVVTEVSNWRRDFNYTLQQYEMRDVFFHDIVKKLLTLGYDVAIVDFENRPSQLLSAYATNKSRQKSFGAPVKPWEKYINLDIMMKSKRGGRKFAELWKELESSNDFINSLAYGGVSIYELIRNDIEDLLKSLKGYTAITFIETAKRIIEKERPSVIVMHDEYGALQLSLINAAREKGIPTVSLQHGLISEEQISYVHKPEHISGEKRDVLFPIPDKMCVWSESSRQDLVEISKFPPSIPFVTGDPKVDFLPAATNLFSYEKVVERLGIPRGKKIIVFATENLPFEEEKSLITRNVFNAIRMLPECYLIVKMHPNEMDVSFYQLIAKEANLQDYSIIRDINLYELLYVSDLVILSYSTVAAEAMRMEKPVISLNLMGLHNNVSFIKNEKAIVVSRSDDLMPSIKKCLENTDEVQGTVQRAKIFAEQELGAADGKSGERVVELILELDQDYKTKKLAPGAVNNIGKQ